MYAETSPNNVHFVAAGEAYSKRMLVVIAVVEKQKKNKIKKGWVGEKEIMERQKRPLQVYEALC